VNPPPRIPHLLANEQKLPLESLQDLNIEVRVYIEIPEGTSEKVV
jgi:hypothetical protein